MALTVKNWTLVHQIKKDVADNLIDNIQVELDYRDKYFTGKARKSFQYDVQLSLVGSDIVYMPNIEWGRLPAPVPFEPIHLWVIGKLGYKDPEAIAIAKKIQHKITVEGFKPTRVVRISLEEIVKRF